MFGKILSGRGRGHKTQDGAEASDKNSMQVNAAPDEQLQKRIIAYFANGQKMELIPVGPVEVTPAQRQNVIQKLQANQISPREIERFLEQILSPIQDLNANLNGIFQRINGNIRERQIMAVAAGYNASNWQDFSKEDLRKLLSKPAGEKGSFQTPVGFAGFRAQFLDGIKAQASPEQFAEYLQAMDDLERDLYNERFVYYQQIQLLAHEGKANHDNQIADDDQARKQMPAQNPDDLALDAIIAEETSQQNAQADQQAAAGVLSAGQPTVSAKTNLMAQITPERSNNILSQAVIEGDPWVQNGTEYRLSTANLLSGGLVPMYETNLDGRVIACSVPFQLSDGRGAVIGYVMDGNSAKVRSFYLNPRTGLWHYAPEIIRGARGEGMGQIGDGYGLDATMLPASLQQQLSELVKALGFREITTVNPDFLFAGTAMAYNTKQEYREALAQGQARGDYYKEVDREPINRGWQPRNNTKNVPQLISVNAEMQPDFQQLLGQFMTYSILVGSVTVNYYLARDGQEIWMFCSDEMGRTWIANIETMTPITTTGCRRDWLQSGDLTTPLYEHSTKAGNYGDPSDTRRGLIGMWNQYLSKIPLIQEYVAVRKQQG